MYDAIVRGGTVVDGTGGAPFVADVAVRDGRIVAVEPAIDADTAELVDARGRVVTPGFVDVHTHFDGQATWDEVLEPSSNHGVTTVVMGNCGVGFAPVALGDRDRLVALMEGVEDIPGAALTEGMSWGWESFAEYLDVLGGRRYAVDVATQVPHGSLRTYVMGEAAIAHDPADDAQVARMAAIAFEAVEAGAFGFSTSRTLGHRALDGTPVPGTWAAEHELAEIVASVVSGGGRVLEVAPSGLARSDDAAVVASEFEWLGRLAADSGVAVTFTLLQMHSAPDRWRHEMDQAARWRARGATVIPLVAGRPFGVIYGWDVRHLFSARPAYREVAHLALGERLVALREPARRAAVLGQADEPADDAERRGLRYIRTVLADGYLLSGTPDYEQHPDRSIGATAERRGVTADEVLYDGLVATDDTMMLYPLYNYAEGDHRVLHEQLLDPDAVLGLDDGGAHCAFICDASIPTYMLSHWVRDRTRGPRLPLAEVVRRLTSQPADLYGMADRGRIRPGLRADLNVIDLDGVGLDVPRAVSDLPAGGTRLLQRSRGYDLTMVGGTVTRRQGDDTGERPGRLLRRG